MNRFLIFISIATFLSLLAGFTTLYAENQEPQKVIQFDDTRKIDWANAFEEVEILSSADGKIQKAMFYGSTAEKPQPLIISLHTWSGNYTQKDPLTREILERNWNYIHPDFRGPNRTPESTCSNLVISDIEDAIQFALENSNANPSEVHIIGVSGGGLATLAAFMNIQYPVKSFSAWAPISDLEAWYWESVGRKQKYANDIANAVSDDGIFNADEAIRRSPLYNEYPQQLRKDAQLFIYEGIHDGYTGSVPITHSINMYNRLVGELKYGIQMLDELSTFAVTDSDLVSDKETISLVTKRYNPDHSTQLFDRAIYLHRKFQNIELTIFEGGHEQLPQALKLIPVEKYSLK